MPTYVEDPAALARERAARVASMSFELDSRRGPGAAQQILDDPTHAVAGGTMSADDAVAKANIARARESRDPAFIAKVEGAGGDPMVTAAAELTMRSSKTAKITVVRGSFQGGTGVEAVTSAGGAEPPVMVMKVDDPGSMNMKVAGTVQVDSAQAGAGIPQVTGMSVQVDPDVVNRAEAGEPADGAPEADRPAPVEVLPAVTRAASPVPRPLSPKQQAAAAQVAAMRTAAAAAALRAVGHGIAGP